MSNSKLLSVKEAANYLRMSQAWLYYSGIPCVRFGRRRLYRIEDLDSYVVGRVQR